VVSCNGKVHGCETFFYPIFCNCFLQTLVIDGLADSRLMQRWRETVASKQVAYVCIENELKRDSNWPPVSQSGKSLVEMMQLETTVNSEDERLLPNGKVTDSDQDPVKDSVESASPEHINGHIPNGSAGHCNTSCAIEMAMSTSCQYYDVCS
jgi:hypothetical protein